MSLLQQSTFFCVKKLLLSRRTDDGRRRRQAGILGRTGRFDFLLRLLKRIEVADKCVVGLIRDRRSTT